LLIDISDRFVLDRVEPFVETLMRLAHPELHPGSCVEIARHKRWKDGFAGDQRTAALALERDGLNGLMFGRAVVDERADETVWAIDLAILAVEPVILAAGCALHDAVVAADT
jgi:hypothetical protein